MEYEKYKKKMEKLGPLPEDMRVFWVGSDLARIEARTTYCLECIAAGSGILAALDDMAQIIGWEAKLVDDKEKDIINALLDNNAVLVKATAEAKGALGRAVAEGADTSGITESSIWDRGYVVTTGRDPYEAYVALMVLEKAAEVQIKSKPFGGPKPLSKSTAKKLHKKYLSQYSAPGLLRRKAKIESPAPVEEDPEKIAEALVSEFKGRGLLVEYGNKLVSQGLVQGTWGNLSIRIDEDSMLTTPSGLDYDDINPEDMVVVDLEKITWDRSGNQPTTEKLMHAGIYSARPDVGAIVHTHSKYCSILAACQMPLEVREESLRAELGEILYISDYAEAGSHLLTKNVVDALGNRKGCILSNHGMVAVGRDLAEAFSVAETMEEAARRLVNDVTVKSIDSK